MPTSWSRYSPEPAQKSCAPSRRFGGEKNPAAKKKAITAIAHTLLKIAYQVLKSGQPYQDLGADFYTHRESPEQRQAWLLRQLHKLNPARHHHHHHHPTGGRLTSGPGQAAITTQRPWSRRFTPHGLANARPFAPKPSPASRAGFAAARPAETQFSCQSFPCLYADRPGWAWGLWGQIR